MSGLHSLTLGDLARENARRYCGRLAVVSERGARFSHADLDVRSTKLANALISARVGSGDRVLWLGQNSARILDLLFAVSKIGACLCVANWRNTEAELVHVVTDFAPSVVFWQVEEDKAPAPAVRAAAPAAHWIQHDGDGGTGFDAFASAGAGVDVEFDIDAAAPVLALYTAGFEGRPRAALLSSDNLTAMCMTTMAVRGYGADERMLMTAPAFHINAYADSLTTLLLGGATVWVRRVEAATLCRLVERERCTRAFLFGLTKEEMADANRSLGHELSSLISAPGSAAWNAMVTVDRSAYGEYPGVYGQTEVSGPAVFEAIGPPALGNAGRSAPLAAVRIWDENGAEVPDGTTGEIVVRGPMVMLGYLNHDAATERMRVEGWRRTNDLGRREPDGSISFIGPKDRMLKSGVENIYPVEVERCINQHPAVHSCAVIGVPDEKWVQTPKAIVRLGDGCELAPDELRDYCRQHLAGYKVPRHVVFTDELPLTDHGIDYDRLDNEHGGGNYPGVNSAATWDGTITARCDGVRGTDEKVKQ